MTNILIWTIISEIKNAMLELCYCLFESTGLREVNKIPPKHPGCIKERRGEANPRAKVKVVHENSSRYDSMVGGKGDRCLQVRQK